MSGEVKLNGQVLVECINEAGEVFDVRHIANKVVASGRAYLAYFLDLYAPLPRPAPITHMALGLNAGATQDYDTQLHDESMRKPFYSVVRNGTQITFVGQFNPGEGPGYFGEFGLFNAGGRGEGTMLARVASPNGLTIDKKATTTIRVTWTISLV